MGIQIIIIVLVLVAIFYFFAKNFVESEENVSDENVKEEIPEIPEEIPVIIVPENLKDSVAEEPQKEVIVEEKIPKTVTEEKPRKETVVAVIRQNDTIEDLWKYGTESEWKKALAYYYDLVPADAKELDKNMENLNVTEIKNLSVEEFFMFLHDEYFVWKYTAKNRLATTRRNLVKYVSEDKMSELSDIHKRLFELDTDDIRKSFRTAGEIKGLSLSGASSLLSILFPEKFGTVEKYTAEALVKVSDAEEIKAIDPDNLKVKDAVLLEEIMRDKAKELNENFKTSFWTPRKIDMILWSMER